MILNFPYYSKIIKNIIYIILLLVGTFLAFKLSIFYLPFLVAFIISIILEPIIKLIMKKTNLSRRTSSIIIFIIASIIILGLLIWGIVTLFSESSNLLNSLNYYIDKGYIKWQELINNNKLEINAEAEEIIKTSAEDIIETITNWIRKFLIKIIDFITSIPNLLILFGITVIALYFICVDKIYIIDQIEHHTPEIWVKRVKKHLNDLIKTLSGYLKAQIVLVIVSFIISLIGLSILKIAGFNIAYPLLMAMLIGFVDALPIFGSGTIMLPWAIMTALNGDIDLGIAIIILLIIMSIIRQLIEPKLVSKHIGIHPIFTLISMYTGFKFIGVIGLLLGPIILIVVKNVFANMIDKGIFKSIMNTSE